MFTVLFAIIKLFFIISLGFVLYKKRIIKEEALSFLTFWVINISVPLLFFTNIVGNLRLGTKPGVSAFLLLSFGLFALALVFAGAVLFFMPKNLRRESTSMICFQNCGYLPMNLALFLFKPEARAVFLLYIFLYTLGFNILMWSVGTFFIFRGKKESFDLRSLLNPPVAGVALALIVVGTGTQKFIPDILISPMKLIGDTAFPLSMIILGVWLAKSRIENFFSDFMPILKVNLIKLVVLPAVVFALLRHFELFSLFGLFILLEAAMPSAASLPIVVQLRKGNSEFVSRGVFFSHLASIVTLPLWIELFLKVSGFIL